MGSWLTIVARAEPPVKSRDAADSPRKSTLGRPAPFAVGDNPNYTSTPSRQTIITLTSKIAHNDPWNQPTQKVFASTTTGLKSHSHYFATWFRDRRWNEGATGVMSRGRMNMKWAKHHKIEIHDTYPSIIAAYVHWIYSSRLGRPVAKNNADLRSRANFRTFLIRCYVFGHKYGDGEFADFVIDVLIRYTITTRSFAVKETGLCIN
ncbi:hypothetical protein EJ08DRAFT_677588 [Tothia fuscella]|uniref:BTB domain-containing protein n=1 Tax=Tothia fuscella TaxID=1048955 RepID=A0A9P4U051_9PEZI|nr:hypothetical protein EJ08DRAFT_677588 [Tothia fuscella]